MLCVILPTESIAEVLARLCLEYKKYFKWFGKVYSKENKVWSQGYFVSGIDLD